MLDPVVEFVTRMFALLGKGVGKIIAWFFLPFIWIKNLYQRTQGIIKILFAILLLGIIIPYIWFLWNVLWIRNFDLDYTKKLHFEELSIAAGDNVSIEGGSDTTKTCGRSAIVDTMAELVDFNVNQNQWISGSLMYKLGLFGLSWDATPWFDNKASFQRGIHRAVTRTSVEMADQLGRTRGTSRIDVNLQEARGNLQIDEFNWYFGVSPFGFKQTSWGSYRSAIKELRIYNNKLSKCEATFDARADNLGQFMDRIAKDIGSASAEIKARAESNNGGWFDTRADNVFMESMGQLYAYYGLLQGARKDFRDIIDKRALTNVWDVMESQTRSALELNPLIISNGREDGSFMPTHLTTIGFYILRVRSNLIEIRSVLDR